MPKIRPYLPWIAMLVFAGYYLPDVVTALWNIHTAPWTGAIGDTSWVDTLMRYYKGWETPPWWLSPVPDLMRFVNAHGMHVSYGIGQAIARGLAPAVAIAAVAGVAILAQGKARRCSYLELRPEGILAAPVVSPLDWFQDYPDTYSRSPADKIVYWFVPWEFLSHVELSKFTRYGKSDGFLLTFHTSDNVRFSITWLDILNCSEPGAFLNALKTWAPHALSEKDLKQLPLTDTSKRYTRLWLSSLEGTPKRDSIDALADGQVVGDGKFRILGTIGSGGQGTAYLAETLQQDKNNSMPSEVVLKEYILPVHQGSLMVDRTSAKLKQEVELLRSINHPKIVKVFDCFVEDYRGYLVLEFVDGMSLRDLVIREGPQSEAFVATIGQQLCEILQHLHNLDPPVVHRDITPENLILDRTGNIKLVDFNVAHQMEARATATVVGKHAYLPPEQFRGRPTAASDIYATGCTMYFLLTGQDPEPITSSHPAELKPDVSPELDAIIAKATALKENQRFAHSQELCEALSQLQE